MNEIKEFSFQQKIKVMTKLYEAGHRTEKDLAKLDVASILKIPNITITDIAVILALQNAVRSNKLYSYLGGEHPDIKESKEG